MPRSRPVYARLLAERLEDRSTPATLTVMNTNDSGAGSLRQAIIEANNETTNPGGDVIVFDASIAGKAINLTTIADTSVGPAALAITSAVTIQGTGETIARSTVGITPEFRLFTVTGAGVFTMSNVTLNNGLARGGAGGGGGGGGAGLGGAIYNQGVTFLFNTLISGNQAIGGVNDGAAIGGGGGLNGGGDLLGNGGSPNGGTAATGVVNNGTAGGFGGGGGAANSTVGIGGNGGAGGFGGGGGSGNSGGGTLPTFAGGAGGFGGGGGKTGTAGNNGGFGGGGGTATAGGGGAGMGGAIFNQGGTIRIGNTTITANNAQGGEGTGATGGNGVGGGIFNLNGTLIVTNSTIAKNTVEGVSIGGGALYTLSLNVGTATPSQVANVSLMNSILSNSIGIVNGQAPIAINDLRMNQTDGTANVRGDAPNMVQSQNTPTGNILGTPFTVANPNLGVLQNNGGLSFTMVPQTGSPAIDTGAISVITTNNLGSGPPFFDQRGSAFHRISNGLPDLGAFEVQVPVNVTPNTIPAGTVGTSYTQVITATGTAGPYNFAVTAGALPNGLTLNSSTGVITGTPTVADNFSFTITATDTGTLQTGNGVYTVKINPTVTVLPTSVTNAVLGVPYTLTFTSTGSPGPFTFALTSGTLPPGLTLNGATGVLSGTPTTLGQSIFSITATDTGTLQTGTGQYSLTVSPLVPVVIAPGTLPSGNIGTPYTQSLSASGPPGPYAFTVSTGAIPTGMTLSTSGVLTGTPAAAGTFNFTVTATASGSNAVGNQAYSVTINQPQPVQLAPTSLTAGIVGTAYFQLITASGTPGPFSFSVVSGALPAGLSLNTSSGAITGLPTAAGTFNFAIGATDNITAQTGSQTYTLTVSPPVGPPPPPPVVPPSPPTGIAPLPPRGPLLVAGAATGGALLFPTSNGQYVASGDAVNFFPGSGVATRVAVADVNGDGTPDYIGVTLPGAPATVSVIDGKTRQLLSAFRPFGDQFTSGLYVAGGDFNGDGKAEVTVSPDLTGTPRILVFNGATMVNGTNTPAVMASFLGLADLAGSPDTTFNGGARVATGDINGDGTLDLLVTAGLGGGPRVTVWNGKGMAGAVGGKPTVNPLANLFVFESRQRDGAFVTSGDVTGDGFADLAFGGGPGGGPRIRIVSGAQLLTLPSSTLESVDLDAPANLASGLVVNNFFSGDPNSRGGVRLTMRDLDGDNLADLSVGSGAGQQSIVRVYTGAAIKSVALQNGVTPTEAEAALNPFGALLFNGVFVG